MPDEMAPYPPFPSPPGRPEYRKGTGGYVATAVRNEFLEEFKQKLTYGKVIELDQLKGHIVELSKDQFGSRYLQHKIQESTAAEKQMIFDEIKEPCVPLMSDLFGNYVIQVLMDHGTSDQRTAVIEKIQGQVKKLSFDMYGCRCVQKAIEVGTIDQKLKLLEEVKYCIADCVDNQNANHVLQKCIEKIPPTKSASSSTTARTTYQLPSLMHALGLPHVHAFLRLPRDPADYRKVALCQRTHPASSLGRIHSLRSRQTRRRARQGPIRKLCGAARAGAREGPI